MTKKKNQKESVNDQDSSKNQTEENSSPTKDENSSSFRKSSPNILNKPLVDSDDTKSSWDFSDEKAIELLTVKISNDEDSNESLNLVQHSQTQQRFSPHAFSAFSPPPPKRPLYTKRLPISRFLTPQYSPNPIHFNPNLLSSLEWIPILTTCTT